MTNSSDHGASTGHATLDENEAPPATPATGNPQQEAQIYATPKRYVSKISIDATIHGW